MGKMDLLIQLDNPFGVYQPGSEITGHVHANVTEPIKARAIFISVDGRAHNQWTVTENSTRNSFDHTRADGKTVNVTPSTHTRSVSYNAYVVYVTGESTMWSAPGGKAQIPVGKHTFPFKFMLPRDCPPSFEGAHGYIRYFCKAKVDRPWKFDITTRSVFTVVPQFDLNLLPQASVPAMAETCKDMGVFLFKHGVVHVKAYVNKGGFVPGESIVLTCDIDNKSSKTVNKVELKLVEFAQYTAYRNGSAVDSAGVCEMRSRNCEKRQQKRTVVELEEKVHIEAGKQIPYTKTVAIPPVVPTFNNCPIIQVEYYVQAKIHSKGHVGNTLSVRVPILIGTVPVQAAGTPQTSVYPSAMLNSNGPLQPSAPPSYEESVFGRGAMKDDEDNKDFAPRYIFYPSMPSMPQPHVPAYPQKPTATPSAPPPDF